MNFKYFYSGQRYKICNLKLSKNNISIIIILLFYLNGNVTKLSNILFQYVC